MYDYIHTVKTTYVAFPFCGMRMYAKAMIAYDSIFVLEISLFAKFDR